MYGASKLTNYTRNKANNQVVAALIAGSNKSIPRDYIIDSGASIHIRNNSLGIIPGSMKIVNQLLATANG